MDDGKVLHIEILSQEQARSGRRERAEEWPAGSAGGAIRRAAKPEKLMRLLSDRNLSLLKLIKSARPQSLTELSRLSGRPKASLTRTLKRMAALGIVTFQKSKGRGKVPVVACDRLLLDVPLGPVG